METELTHEELTAEALQAEELIGKFKSMSYQDLLTDIFRHEKEVKGIDWAHMVVDESLSPLQIREKANKQAKIYLRELQAELKLTDEELPDFTRQFLEKTFSASDVQVMPAWAISPEEAKEWKEASGEKLKEMISYRLKIMQSLELTSSPAGYAQLMLSIGILAWMKKAYNIYSAARAAGLLRLASVVKAIKGVTLQATKMFVATIILAVITEILLYLMEKDAVVYMVLINMTDDDLKLNDQYLTHGKQKVQFVNPAEGTHEDKTLIKRSVTDLGGGEVDIAYWTGLYVAQKKDMALYGSQGAFRFADCNSYANGAYVGWEIPLTNTFFSGGPNRCLVSANNEGNVGDFSNKTDKHGSLLSESSNSAAKVVGKMHSGKGSEGYMSVIFEPRG